MRTSIQKHFSLLLSLSLLAIILWVSCTSKPTESIPEKSQPDLASLNTEIQSRLREYERLLAAGDSITLGEMYTLDSELLPRTQGRAAITQVIGEMVRTGVTGTFETTEIWGNEDLIIEDGRGTWMQNGEVNSTGKYLLVWVKEEGEWKILKDAWYEDQK